MTTLTGIGFHISVVADSEDPTMVFVHLAGETDHFHLGEITIPGLVLPAVIELLQRFCAAHPEATTEKAKTNMVKLSKEQAEMALIMPKGPEREQ